MARNHKGVKNELENRQWYRRKLKEVNEKIEVLWNDYRGVKGVRYDKPHLAPSEAVIAEIKLTLGEDLEPLLIERRRLKMQLKYIDEILASLDDEIRGAVELVCCEGRDYERVARRYNMSPSGLWKRINSALEKSEKEIHSPF